MLTSWKREKRILETYEAFEQAHPLFRDVTSRNTVDLMGLEDQKRTLPVPAELPILSLVATLGGTDDVQASRKCLSQCLESNLRAELLALSALMYSQCSDAKE